jgi:protein-S-isoprenylcysteine O-methyltransferase Ste14
MKIKINAILVMMISVAVSIIIVLSVSKFSQIILLVCGVLFLFAASEIAILYFTKRHVIYRKQNIYALLSIVFMAAAFVFACINLYNSLTIFPAWATMIGVVLLITGNYMLVSALISTPRHGKDEYSENDTKDDNEFNKYGPYDTIRHPINFAGILIAISIPLILGSAWAFIPAGISMMLNIVHAVAIDTHRFEEYSWYYEYTKKVPFMMVPLIW